MAEKSSRFRKMREDARAFLDERALARHDELPRLHKFAHFWLMVWRSFSRNRCPVRASALAYATLLALIPMLAVVVSITSSLLKKEGEERIDQFIVKLVASVTPAEQRVQSQETGERKQETEDRNQEPASGIVNPVSSIENPSTHQSTNPPIQAATAPPLQHSILPCDPLCRRGTGGQGAQGDGEIYSRFHSKYAERDAGRDGECAPDLRGDLHAGPDRGHL